MIRRCQFETRLKSKLVSTTVAWAFFGRLRDELRREETVAFRPSLDPPIPPEGIVLNKTTNVVRVLYPHHKKEMSNFTIKKQKKYREVHIMIPTTIRTSISSNQSDESTFSTLRRSIRERLGLYRSAVRKGLRSVADDNELESQYYQTHPNYYTASFFTLEQDTSPYDTSFNDTNLFYYWFQQSQSSADTTYDRSHARSKLTAARRHFERFCSNLWRTDHIEGEVQITLGMLIDCFLN